MQKILVMLLMTFVVMLNLVAAQEHHPPHNGSLVVLGENFAHLEFVLDSTTGTLSAFPLDGQAEHGVRLKQGEIVLMLTLNGQEEPLELPLKAVDNPLTGERAGRAFQFSEQSDDLIGIKKFSGVITELNIKKQDFKDIAFDFPQGKEKD